jgi:hypothetical protein
MSNIPYLRSPKHSATMEAIIRTKDKTAFDLLVRFLRSLQFEVETIDRGQPDAEATGNRTAGLGRFSFQRSMEATKGIKGSVCDAVIEDRRSQ